MKILYITGDEYSAMGVDKEIGIKEAYKRTLEKGGEYTYESDDTYALISIREFGEVDPKFVQFIQNNFIDYDKSKHTDFFVVE